MASKVLFKITVLNWEKHNPNRKKSYKYTLIANNFCSDSKINVLPLSAAWFYLGTLLICGDNANDTVMITERQANDMLRSRLGCRNALDLLQSLQLLTYEIIEKPLILNELKEKNRRERNREPTPEKPIGADGQESFLPTVKKTAEPALQDSTGLSLGNKTQEILAHYAEAFKKRYKANPHIGGKETGIIQNHLKKTSVGKLAMMVQVYLQMEDPWFLKRKHDLATFTANMNKIAIACQTGEDDDIGNVEKWYREKMRGEKGLTV